MKKRLQSLAALALSLICVVSTALPFGAKAAVIDKTIDFSASTDDDLFQSAYLDWQISDGAYVAGGAWASTYLKEAFDLSKDMEIKLDFKLPIENDAAHHFKIGLVNVNTSNHTISGGATAHFYKHEQWGDITTLNSTFESAAASWYADIATNYYDGNMHTMTITVADKKAVFQIDGKAYANQNFASADLGANPVYLAFQSANTNCTVDNISIDFEEATEYDTLNLDFGKTSDGEKFAVSYLGWKIDAEAFVPNGEWASAYLKGVVPLKNDKELSFQFTLPEDAGTSHEFKVGLVDMSTGTPSGGVTAHFRNNGAIDLVTINSEFSGAGQGAWYADHVANYFDGQPHTMTIVIQNKVATYQIDGETMTTTQAFSGANIVKDAVSLMIQSSLAGAKVDNIVLKDYVPKEPEPSPRPLEYQEMFLDFAEPEDGEVFTTTYGGWTVADGVYKPNLEWANTYPSFQIPLDEDKEISFDFYMSDKGDKNHQFNFGLVDIDGQLLGEGLAAHFYYSSQWKMELFTLNQDIGNPIGKGWLADYTTNYNDGQVHHMLLAVKDGKASFYIDGDMVAKKLALSAKEAYFVMQFTSTKSYIDNFKLSDTLTVNPDKDQVKQPANNVTPTTKEPTPYHEVKLDFSAKKQEEEFATTYEGWSVSDGVYKANTPWANTYFNSRIPLTGEKEISFDFCLKNNGDKNHQFNVGFVDIVGEKVNSGLAAHFYQHAQYGELLTLNRDFGNPIGEGYLADNMDNYNDGKTHFMMIRYKNQKVDIYIDGKAIFEDIALDHMKNAIFMMQFTSVHSYIDNFRVSNTLTYIPDYPTSTPDPTGDAAVQNTDGVLSLVAANGKIVRAFNSAGEGLSPLALAGIIAGGVVVAAGAVVATVVIGKKKRVK